MLKIQFPYLLAMQKDFFFFSSSSIVDFCLGVGVIMRNSGKATPLHFSVCFVIRNMYKSEELVLFFFISPCSCSELTLVLSHTA